ncbi:MAG: urease accessory protein UreD [Timaviella obliquedivisa GSE-PSE-MK23-08B]|jgi:urease accessory protein|nr:urease accessory protein UreD [Timaviella obliquedivisa GSE-PSE-MK23-08B]
MRLIDSSKPTGWQGNLQLEFGHREGETILSRSLMQAPLKIQRPFYPEGKSICHGVMLHTAGGIVGGDRLSSQIRLHPNAQVLLTTAAATKVYGSDQESNQVIHVQVAENAGLEWLPQETIIFDGARYRQAVRVELETGATWLGWDITRLGRSARGEQFLSGEWRSHLEVWQAGQLLWVDPQWLVGGSEMLWSAHGLSGCAVVGSFGFVGREVSPEFVAEVRSRLAEGDATDFPAADMGVTRLMNGFLCRYRGNSTTEARQRFTQVWDLLRQHYLGRSGCLPRVWQR